MVHACPTLTLTLTLALILTLALTLTLTLSLTASNIKGLQINTGGEVGSERGYEPQVLWGVVKVGSSNTTGLATALTVGMPD